MVSLWKKKKKSIFGGWDMLVNEVRGFKLYPHPFSRFGVDPDSDRFQQIIRGKVREELKKFISREKMNIIKGGKVVQLPKPVIDLPRFTRGTPQEGGVGSGKGEEGDQIGQIGKDGQPISGDEAGEGEGQHNQEEWGPEITRSEIARLIMEDLHLPNLEPKGSENVKQTNIKWTSLSRTGSNVHVRATLLEAIKRAACEQGEELNPEDIVIQPQDVRYYSWQKEEKPHANAVIIYILDVSGSVGEIEKEIARTANFYMSTVIQHQFGELNSRLREEAYDDNNFGEGVEEVFIIHDSSAKEVNEKEFYTTVESGGTKISSAYKLAQKIIQERYPPDLWNIYTFHYSDGDNWSDDNEEAFNAINQLLPKVNQLGYIQLKSTMTSGKFKEDLETKFGTKNKKLRTSLIGEPSKEEYTRVIKDMLSESEGGNNG